MSRRSTFGTGSGMGRIVALLAASGVAGVASAQIAPPPTQGPAPTPAPTTPPPRSATPAQPTQSAGDRARDNLRRDPTTVPLPDLPYESLVKRDADGHVVALGQSPHLLALDVNPMMDDSTVERAQGVILARRDKIEHRVAENVDLIQQVLDGAIDRVDITRPDSIRGIIDVVRPFQELGHLSDDLKEQGILTEQQWAFNWKIAQEYTQAYQRDVLEAAAESQDPSAPSPQTVFTRMVMQDFMREPLRVYDELLAEASGRIDQVMAPVSLSSEQEGQASSLRQAVSAATTDDGRKSAVQALITFLTPEQRKAFMQAILDSR